MRRRTVLAGVAFLPAVLAGCTGRSGGDAPTATSGPTTEQSDTPTGEPTEPTRDAEPVSGSLSPLEACPNPGDATVEPGDGSATVRGCVVGRNGCTIPRLRDVALDSDTGVVTVVVAAVDVSSDEEACTQALVDLGYEVRVDAGDAGLTGVEVVHEDVDGRRVVADVTR